MGVQEAIIMGTEGCSSIEDRVFRLEEMREEMRREREGKGFNRGLSHGTVSVSERTQKTSGRQEWFWDWFWCAILVALPGSAIGGIAFGAFGAGAVAGVGLWSLVTVVCMLQARILRWIVVVQFAAIFAIVAATLV